MEMHPLIDKYLRRINLWQSMKGRVFLFSAIILALAFIIISIFVINMFKVDLLNSKRVENLGIAEQISTMVEIYMDSILNTLNSVSMKRLFLEEILVNPKDDVNILFSQIKDAQALIVSDIYGNELLYISREGAEPKPLLNEKDTQERLETVLKGKNYIGHAFLAAQKMPMVEISVPIKGGDTDQIQGMLSAVISLVGFFKRLDQIKLKTAQEIYLVDTNGWAIANLSQTSGQRITETEDISAFWGDLGNSIKVRQYMSGISELKLRKPLVYKNIRRKDVLGVLVICPKLKWGIIMEEELDEIFESMNPMIRKYILIASLIFFVLCILALATINLLTSPIVKLYRSTEGLGKVVERVFIQGTDEIGRIGQNLNQLIEEIHKKDEDLRHRYKEMEEVSREFEGSYNQFEKITKDLEDSQKNLLWEKNFFSRILEGINLLIVGLNPEGKVIICNAWCEQKLHYGRDEIKGRDWFEIVYPFEMQTAARSNFNALLEGKSFESIKDQIIAKDGKILQIAWHFIIINNTKGLPECIVFIGEDIGQKEMSGEDMQARNLQLMKNNEELEDILSIVSHDLQNPLSIIMDYASILLQDYKGTISEDGLYYIERLMVNAKLMEKMIIDLLELSRTSRTKGLFQECPISEIVKRAVEEFKEPIRAKGIQLRISEGLPICTCEPDRILQVFMNLISNSIKFMYNTTDPVIEIGYREGKDKYEFYVKDNGIGIEPEYHEKIFVIFQRLQDVKGVEGTGVGLTIVKKIIENHGGKVWVESKKGEGAAFYFTIPKGRRNSISEHKANRTLNG